VLEKGANWKQLTWDLKKLHEDFMICNKIKVEEMGKACSTNTIGVLTIFAKKTLRIYSEDLGIDKGIILE
jgi:hypothetical protein